MEIQAKNERMMNEILINHSFILESCFKSMSWQEIFF